MISKQLKVVTQGLQGQIPLHSSASAFVRDRVPFLPRAQQGVPVNRVYLSFSAFYVFVFHSPRNFGFREINGPKRELYFKKQNDS